MGIYRFIYESKSLMCRFKTGSSKKTKNNVKANFKRFFHLFLKIILTGLKVAKDLKVY